MSTKCQAGRQKCLVTAHSLRGSHWWHSRSAVSGIVSVEWQVPGKSVLLAPSLRRCLAAKPEGLVLASGPTVVGGWN